MPIAPTVFVARHPRVRAIVEGLRMAVSAGLFGMTFVWDDKKAEANVAKHGATFDEAKSVFVDPFAFVRDDPDHSTQEDRRIIVGIAERNRLLFVSHMKDGLRFRIISARKATSHEQRQHEARLKSFLGSRGPDRRSPR